MKLTDAYDQFAKTLLQTEPIHRREWQSMNTTGSHAHATHELLNVVFQCPINPDVPSLAEQTGADMPWAEDHFLERVSGVPHNPPPSHTAWPYAVRENSNHTDADGRFDHTYPERFWPRHAGHTRCDMRNWTPTWQSDCLDYRIEGIRYRYGDLGDVVAMLVRNPFTRQAYLPVWFPEDTGAVAGQRVPCTLGYHFIMDNNYVMHVNYFIRSCDLVRHFRNDVYLAGRLLQWITQQVNERMEVTSSNPHARDEYIHVGTLSMFITSLHSFVGDDWRLRGESAKS